MKINAQKNMTCSSITIMCFSWIRCICTTHVFPLLVQHLTPIMKAATAVI